ncbi:MAG: hypothetical protein HYZ53_09745 [Planctomycetes bacterium]|nr:hypothetical protein [Planctomycetota bacterium]
MRDPLSRGGERRGSALLLALVLVIVLLGYSGVVLKLSLANSHGIDGMLEQTRATYVAEAGVYAALSELNAGVDRDGDGLGTIARNYPNAENAESGYGVVATRRTDGRYRLVACGKTTGGLRAIEVLAEPDLGFGDADAALGLFGPVGKHLKFKVFSDRTETDDVDPDVADTVHIDGTPADGGAALPAVAVQDPLAYVLLLEKLSREIAKGKVSAGAFRGAPEVDYTNSAGFGVRLPIVQNAAPHFDPTTLDSLRDQLLDRTRNELVPHAAATIAEDGGRLSGLVTWGTPLTPQTTVVTGKDLQLQSGAVLSGAGTLVIYGELKLQKDAVLHWTGDVIVVGNEDRSDSAKLKVEGGTLGVTGNVLVLGSTAGAADFLVDDHGQRSASATVTGAVLALAGPEDKKRARIRVDGGNFTVDGLLAAYGEKVELKVEEGHHDTGAFTASGTVVVATPENLDEKHEKLGVKLFGNTSIRLDRAKLAAAMNSLVRFLGENEIRAPLRITSWREVSPYLPDVPRGLVHQP